MSNVIFLDFDGPLYPKKIFVLDENKGYEQSEKCKELNLYPLISYWKMDECAIGMLNNFAENEDSIFVLSTSWTELHDKETLVNLLIENGFRGQVHDDWRLVDNKEITRAEKIKIWLNEHPEYGSKYIIIDDIVSAPEMQKSDLMVMYGLNPEKIFLVPEEEGLMFNIYKKISNTIYEENRNNIVRKHKS